MYVLKKLYFILFVSTCLAYADVESEIRDNELLINTLQEKIEKGESSGDLQKIMDKLIEKQNALLAKKAAGVSDDEVVVEQATQTVELVKQDNELDARIRKIVREELAKQIHPGDYNHSSEAKAKATEKAAETAPDLPEQKSDAMAQYELALEQYDKGEYKLAASSFGRIIKAYPKDPITAKALVHLAFCLEKQNELDKAVVVCEEALKKKLDVGHQADCYLIHLRHAKQQKNEKEAAEITQTLKGLKLTDEQKKTFSTILGKK